jgi:hypothetical protein
MIASTLLAIPFVPVFYIVMQRVKERPGKRAKALKEAEVSRASTPV